MQGPVHGRDAGPPGQCPFHTLPQMRLSSPCLAVYCGVTDHPKAGWLKQVILVSHRDSCQELGRGSVGGSGSASALCLWSEGGWSWSSRRLSGHPSVFMWPHSLTVWSLHTGWVGLPHGMAASGLQQVYSSWQGGSFVIRLRQCLFCHFLLSRSKSQTHSDSRGRGTGLHLLTGVWQGSGRTCTTGDFVMAILGK